MIHLRTGVPNDFNIFRQEAISEEAEQGREGLLLREIAGGAEDNDDGVILELFGPKHSHVSPRILEAVKHCCGRDAV